MNTIIRRVDALLNSLTMYRLLLYGLAALLFLAALLGFAGVLPISGAGIVAVTTVLLISSYASNKLLGRLYQATTNSESYLITALILALILPPSTDPKKLFYIAFAGMIAAASKFILSYRHKHIFNPAAVAAVVVSLLGLVSVTWWIGNPTMLPFVVLFGLLIIRKIHRFKMVIAFMLASIAMLVLVGLVGGLQTSTLIKNAVISGPLIFMATVMLTEPTTMPSKHYYQILYGLLVGSMYTAQLRFGLLSTSPHMVLLVGNVFAYIVNPKIKSTMRLKEKVQISPRVFDFIFLPDKRFDFIPGQYMEFTLKHTKEDLRGNRRSFTIASSPTEAEIHLGVKFYEPSSSFKHTLQAMQPGDRIDAGQLSGNFLLPADAHKKLVFIAGGVGITPFRSMVKYLTDTKEQRDITLFYNVNKEEELAYAEVFKAYPGLQYIPVVGAKVSARVLSSNVDTNSDCLYYISGPNGLVELYRRMLRHSGVPATHIITDYFSGY